MVYGVGKRPESVTPSGQTDRYACDTDHLKEQRNSKKGFGLLRFSLLTREAPPDHVRVRVRSPPSFDGIL